MKGNSMKGTKVLITGGGRGIGVSLAEALASEGCSLALCARTANEVKAVSERLSGSFGVPVHPFSCDVSDRDEAERMVAATVEALGGIDVLVNNAAVAGPLGPLEETGPDAWQHAIEVNLLGTVHCCRAVLPAMKRGCGGRIVNFAGGGVGWKGFEPGKTAYITSKFAVYGFTEALAREVESDNIRVNALSPGPVDTGLRDALNPGKPLETGKSAEAAQRMVVFLASDRSGPLTGKILSANWDDPEELAAQAGELNDSCRKTLRKIDDRNYFER